MKPWLIFLIVLLLAGIVYAHNNPNIFNSVKNKIQIKNPLCNPNYITIGEDLVKSDDECKTDCYDSYKVTSHKITSRVFESPYPDLYRCALPPYIKSVTECESYCRQEYGTNLINSSYQSCTGCYENGQSVSCGNCWCNYNIVHITCYCDINNCNP